MNIENLTYLKDVLGEGKAKQYIPIDNERINYMVKILKNTIIVTILGADKVLIDLCDKIAYGKYYKVFVLLLLKTSLIIKNNSKKEDIIVYYKNIIYLYIKDGFRDKDKYFDVLKLFEKIDGYFLLEYKVNINTITMLVSFLENLNISVEAKSELLNTYYESLDVRKKDGFMTKEMTIRNRPNLYRFLKTNNYLVDLRQIDNNKKVRKFPF